MPANAAVLGERVFAASGAREVAALSLDGGKQAWRVALGTGTSTAAHGQPSSAAPALAHGRLVVRLGAEPYTPGSSLVCIG